MLKHLNTDEMVALIASWIDPKRRAEFVSISEIAPLHPKIVVLHTEMVAARPAGSGVSADLQKIIDEILVVDGRHDALARAVSTALDADAAHALSLDPPDAARAARADEVKAKILPGGLAIVNATPLAESGNTERVASLLAQEPAVAAFLKSIPMRGKTNVLDAVHLWIAAGAELGKLERRRDEAEAKEATGPAGAPNLGELRGRWLQLVSLVLSNLEVTAAPAATIEIIRGPVLKASTKAGKRYATAPATPPAVPPPVALNGSASRPSLSP